MTPEVILDVGQHALWVTSMLAAPLLLSALAVGKDGRAVAVCLCRAGPIGRVAGDETVKLLLALLRSGLGAEDKGD